jgi:pyruvate kinase
MVADPGRVQAEVDALRSMVVAADQHVDGDHGDHGDRLGARSLHAAHEASAANLAHFVALRSEDLRGLQDQLAELGLSSLGRCEAHVLATLDAVRRALAALAGSPPPAPDEHGHRAPGFGAGQGLLEYKAEELLGPATPGRPTRIMVTLPSEAADDPRVVEELVDAGMDIARINCAHDDADAWSRMAGNVRAAALARGRDVRVMMDLAGPKLRTSSMAPGPAVIRLKPDRDAFGKVVAPASARLCSTSERSADEDGPPSVFIDGGVLDDLVPDDVLHLVDARGKRRSMRVGFVGAQVEVTTHGTVYLVEGTELRNLRTGSAGVVGPLRPAAGHVELDVGRLVELVAGDPPDVEGDPTPEVVAIGCTLPEAVDALQVGHRVFFDDGSFGGRVESVGVDAAGAGLARVRITSGPPGGGKVRAEKGINLPDTDVPVPALSADDLRSLDAVVELADMVALSFVRTPDDVRLLQDELARRGADHLGLVLKIETVQAFRALPDLLRAAMATRSVGVMIARGDLAVEAGYERLAELQEEILWLCEAAHLPVIWATEVLDRLAKTGRPSRSEITDAAMSERAECVMLNKGRHIVQAITTLDDILRRMAEHQSKKRQLLRPLRSWADAAG